MLEYLENRFAKEWADKAVEDFNSGAGHTPNRSRTDSERVRFLVHRQYDPWTADTTMMRAAKRAEDDAKERLGI